MPLRRAGFWRLGLACLPFIAVPSFAVAAAPLDGAELPAWLALPFAGLLLCIAIAPVLVRRLWHLHSGKAATFWAVLTLIGLVAMVGRKTAGLALGQTFFADYLPFVLMLFALFTASGGLAVSGTFRGTPRFNCALLALGALLASLVGTTGASLILIRPLIAANRGRRAKAHLAIFFIFLVSNIGGALSPLGDPPLFLGFLNGVAFFWPLTHLWPQTLLTCVLLLAIFYALDLYFMRHEKRSLPASPERVRVRLKGAVNIPLIVIAVAAIALTGSWRPGAVFSLFGIRIEAQNAVRDAMMLAVGCASLMLTPAEARRANRFEWAPLQEVAKLFAGLFVCIIPVTAMFQAGAAGAFAPLLHLLETPAGAPRDALYFWTTGLASSVLDNAPTYLVFFGLAGGDAARLMGPLAQTLAAISLGAVFMGALTYIGNAPNLMVYAIVSRARIRMPGFFGYMAWSGTILLPIFAAITFLFMM